MAKIKIIFMGTPEFSVVIAEALKDADYIDLVLIITNPDKKVGRKQILNPSPIKVFAQKYQIPFLQPENIKTEEFYNQLISVAPDLIVVASYGKIIPKNILNIPKYGSINVHPSLLPKWRGPSPIQYSILHGDKETGTTIMLIDEQMDHGPILAQQKLKNNELGIMNYEKLSKKLADLSADLLIKTIPLWIEGKIKPRAQDDTKATYSKILKKEDGKIDFKKETAIEIERKMRAFYPWPGAYAEIQISGRKQILKILQSEIIEISPKNLIAGQFFITDKNELAAVCKIGALILKQVQLEGKKSMGGIEFYRGHREIIKEG